MIAETIEHPESKALEANPWNRYRSRAPFPTAKDLGVAFSSAIDCALEQSKYVVTNCGILGGTPCVVNTRIPVYMILDAVEFHGSLDGVMKSYPDLTIEQIKDAVLFAANILECPCGK
jgi:uncharacterized protein (DUF433 family)